jgi:hypothetical protein
MLTKSKNIITKGLFLQSSQTRKNAPVASKFYKLVNFTVMPRKCQVYPPVVRVASRTKESLTRVEING